MFLQDENSDSFFYILRVHWPHSYIHTFIHPVMFYGAQYHNVKWVVFWLNDWLFICQSLSFSVFETERTALLLFCRGRNAHRPTDPRPISTFTWSWSYTGTKMFSQQWREKHASVVWQNTWIIYQCYTGQPIMQCIILSVLYWENIPLLMLATLSEVICTGNIREDETQIATEFS